MAFEDAGVARPRDPNSLSEIMRLIPRGLRFMLETRRPLEDMPDASIQWLMNHKCVKHDTRPGRHGYTWTNLGHRARNEVTKKASFR